MKKVRLISSLLMSLLLGFNISGCSWNDPTPDSVEDKSPKQLYEESQLKIKEGDYKRAAEVLEALNARYPYGQLSDQTNLDLIYCYYKNNDNTKGLQTADRFINANPTHKDLDYVYYMRGLILMQLDTDFLHSLFAVERYDRDPTYAEEAFRDFGFIVNQMKDSKYAPDAKIRMLSIKNRLAKYYVSVAQYYYDRRAYIAAANRTKKIVDSFYDTVHVEKALEIMILSYQKLGLYDMENDARHLMYLNFPSNSLARD